MKRITPYCIYMLIMGVATFLAGCDDSYPHNNQSLKPSFTARYLYCAENALDFGYMASSQSISIESVNTSWHLSNAANWLDISQLSGNSDASVSVSATESPSCEVARTSEGT